MNVSYQHYFYPYGTIDVYSFIKRLSTCQAAKDFLAKIKSSYSHIVFITHIPGLSNLNIYRCNKLTYEIESYIGRYEKTNDMLYILNPKWYQSKNSQAINMAHLSGSCQHLTLASFFAMHPDTLFLTVSQYRQALKLIIEDENSPIYTAPTPPLSPPTF